MKGGGRFLAYNAQAAASLDQIILAADVVQDANDVKQLVPMVEQAQANVERTGAEGMAAEIEARALCQCIAPAWGILIFNGPDSTQMSSCCK